MQAAIGYLRVSTRERGRSGLGLAAQLPTSSPAEVRSLLPMTAKRKRRQPRVPDPLQLPKRKQLRLEALLAAAARIARRLPDSR